MHAHGRTALPSVLSSRRFQKLQLAILRPVTVGNTNSLPFCCTDFRTAMAGSLSGIRCGVSVLVRLGGRISIRSGKFRVNGFDISFRLVRLTSKVIAEPR